MNRPDSSKLPQATRRCWDCGVAYGPCVCTREFELYEGALEVYEEEQAERLDYLDSLIGEQAA